MIKYDYTLVSIWLELREKKFALLFNPVLFSNY